MIVDFVDVSVYQGDIDWQALTVPAIIKATEGATFTDPRFFQNRDGARAAGKCLGFYHFLASTSDGVAQANHFLRVVQPGPDELLCLDWETDSIGVRPDPNQAKDWIDTVRSLGYLNVRLYGNEWLAAYALQWDIPFWCAWYGNAEQQVTDRNAVAWQWSSEEFVPGIPSRVDVNQVLDEEGWYVGMTAEQFAAMLGDKARANNGVVEIQLSDGNWYPFSHTLQFIHTEAQTDSGSGGGASATEVVDEIGRRLQS